MTGIYVGTQNGWQYMDVKSHLKVQLLSQKMCFAMQLYLNMHVKVLKMQVF